LGITASADRRRIQNALTEVFKIQKCPFSAGFRQVQTVFQSIFNLESLSLSRFILTPHSSTTLLDHRYTHNGFQKIKQQKLACRNCMRSPLLPTHSLHASSTGPRQTTRTFRLHSAFNQLSTPLIIMSSPLDFRSPSWWPLAAFFKDGKASKDELSAPPPLPRPSNELYDLINDRNWDSAIHHCRSEHNHIDAAFQDGDTLETPLYLACQNHPPVTLIFALLQAFPAGAETPSRHGDLPLDIACRYNVSIEVLRELVKDHPDTVGQSSKWGKTAVSALWEGRPIDVDTVDTDTGITCIEERYSNMFWQKMQVLLEALATSRQQAQGGQPTDMLYIVHAVVALGSLGCPYEVLKYVLHRYPEQVSQTDGMGRLPLHIAVGPAQWSHRSRRKYKPREKRVIARLLKMYPPGARTLDPTELSGRYPLHTALTCRHQWLTGGVKELFEGAPEAISLPDPVTCLYPFQLAAIPIRETTVCLDTIYHLLRAQPAVLEQAQLPTTTALGATKTRSYEETALLVEPDKTTDSNRTTTWFDHLDLDSLPVSKTFLYGGACALLGVWVAYARRDGNRTFTLP
jgi:hypothetical protein